MKYKQISSLVPQGENFDESAIVNEGGWLSTGHLDAVEAALSENASAANTEAMEQANAQIQELTDRNASLQNDNDAVQESLDIANTRIQSLEAQVKELSKQPSGNGTPLNADTDPVDDPVNKKRGLMNEDHPLNKAARAQVAKKKR